MFTAEVRREAKKTKSNKYGVACGNNAALPKLNA